MAARPPVFGWCAMNGKKEELSSESKKKPLKWQVPLLISFIATEAWAQSCRTGSTVSGNCSVGGTASNCNAGSLAGGCRPGSSAA